MFLNIAAIFYCWALKVLPLGRSAVGTHRHCLLPGRAQGHPVQGHAVQSHMENKGFKVGQGFALGLAIKGTHTIHLKCYTALEFWHVGLLKVWAEVLTLLYNTAYPLRRGSLTAIGVVGMRHGPSMGSLGDAEAVNTSSQSSSWGPLCQ